MFKDNYRREMDRIKPDAAFINQLAEQMKQEEEKNVVSVKSGKRKKIIAACSAVAAAFALFIGVTFYQKWQQPKDNIIVQNAGEAVDELEETTQEGMFAGGSWYGKETNASNIYEILLDKIKDDKKVTVYKSDVKEMDEAPAIGLEEQEQLVKILNQGVYAGDYETMKENITGNANYYLLEFSDNTVIKFEIWDNQYFYCSDFDGVFVLESE